MINLKSGKHFTDAQTMTRGGFIKGILASGIAPSITLATIANAGSANASVGGMMRNVGARNAAMFGGKSLPYDRKVNWIRSQGRQYINTNLQSNSNLELEIIASTDYASGEIWFGGARSGTNFSFLVLSNSHVSFDVASRFETNFVYPRDDSVIKIGFKNNNGYINDELVTDTYTVTGNSNFWLFTPNRSYILFSCIKIYSAKFWISNALVGDFIPVVATFNGLEEGCMYDNVTKTLFRNSGDGSFTFG